MINNPWEAGIDVCKQSQILTPLSIDTSVNEAFQTNMFLPLSAFQAAFGPIESINVFLKQHLRSDAQVVQNW